MTSGPFSVSPRVRFCLYCGADLDADADPPAGDRVASTGLIIAATLVGASLVHGGPLGGAEASHRSSVTSPSSSWEESCFSA